MRIAADGYIDLTDTLCVRTPGRHTETVDPVDEGEALAFLLSHAFRGHRLVTRPLTIAERRRIRLALWADSVSERMAIVDRVWRSISAPTEPPSSPGTPELIQVLHFGAHTYPLYLDGDHTRIIPGAVVPDPVDTRVMIMDFDRKTA